VNIYKVLEGKYDGPAFAKASAGKPVVDSAKAEGANDNATFFGNGSVRRSFSEGVRTSRGDLIYIPRQ
jgi:hypothetical protein